ncbi:homoserine dehydrogenase [Stenotrophomonas rhizophila]|uniref:Homoserine dehydrogenase n=1 Tax=Stenotrophomonas rhizophila TaxID=216778 RepID=A0AAP5E8J1_9GAMM|nr:homoserine dehydrogenase [Stenotrophomonas rhizophila]MDQ1107794.1 homoserine dehydrogenase [Stenotrophomonas rhizophila]
MSAVLPFARPAPRRLALLGTGTVGTAFVQRYQALEARGVELPQFSWLANSRTARACEQQPAQALARANDAARTAPALQPWAEAEGLQRGDVVVDATASDDVANWHEQWLARGVHVVTANKLGQGAQLARAQAIAGSGLDGGARYGDSATVGAGLPLLSSLRGLVAGGDRIHRVEGVLSGSLAWLFHHYDGQRPFSAWVREAAGAGYTEPDPRVDLSGEDVRRKLLILARASGIALRAEQVAVNSLVPDALAALPTTEAIEQLALLDAPLQRHWEQARAQGGCLRFIGGFDHDGATVGLRIVPLDHPLAGGAQTDNRVAIHSDRYNVQPLLIQGPGAGAGITAAALLDDVLSITRPSTPSTTTR